MYIKAKTSGNMIRVVEVKRSKIRKFFGLPYIKVIFAGKNLQGPVIRAKWCQPKEIFDEVGLAT